MPMYEYECKDCRQDFDFEHSMDEVVDTCPICGSKRVERLIPANIGVHGISIGRFSSNNDNNFEHFHIPTEMKQNMAKMEAMGLFKKDPKFASQMEQRFKKIMAKEHTYERVDYQKTGHPCLKKSRNVAEI